MRQVILTPQRGADERKVNQLIDWLIRKRMKHELPFDVVVRDNEAYEQFAVMIQCRSLQHRNALLATLKQVQEGALPASTALVDGLREATIGKVFE